MEKYTVLEVLGEGSYGKVLKCRHNESGTLVAIKKFIETEENSMARKVALREIRMLKKLHHPNLVSLLEVFRRKKRFHLVFEYMCCSLLEELETQGKLPAETARRHMYQILRGVDYCHSNNVIHRDIKPENILISGLGLVKLCDFGFARSATLTNEPFTDYVATRWYRPPELLVGETIYGRAVDIWALGCILIEILTGSPLFPGDSDIDQLYKITKLLGSLTEGQKLLVDRTACRELGTGDLLYLIRSRLKMDPVYCLRDAFPDLGRRVVDFVAACLRVDPDSRPGSDTLLRHSYFTCDLFLTEFVPELHKKVQLELARRVPVSGLPCPRDNQQHFLSAMPSARKQSHGIAWSISMIPDGSPDQPSIYKEFIEEQKSTMCRETAIPGKSASYIVQRSKEREENPLEKVRLPYKRNMMPGTKTYLKPVRGRLLYDKLLALPCDFEALDRPPSEGICLPLIKTTERKLISDKKNAQLKRKKSSSIDMERTKSQRELNNDECTNSEDGKSSHISLPYYHFPGT